MYTEFSQVLAFRSRRWQLHASRELEIYVPINCCFLFIFCGCWLLASPRDRNIFTDFAIFFLLSQVLASRSRRWQLHASRELECLKMCDHPYIVSIAYAFQTPQYLYMVQVAEMNSKLNRYLYGSAKRTTRKNAYTCMTPPVHRLHRLRLPDTTP